MDFLTSLETNQLLVLVVAILACAVMLAAVTLAYLLLSVRRARRGTQPAAMGEKPDDPPAVAAESRDDAGNAVSPEVVHRIPVEVGFDPGATAGDDAGTPVESAGEVLRVLVDGDGRCSVHIEGKEYARWEDVPDLLVRENILRAAVWCLRFSKGLVLTGQGAVMVEVPENTSVPVPEPAAGESTHVGADTLLRIVSDSRAQGFWVQAAGARPYSALYQAPDKVTGERILKGITRLLQFCEGRVAADGGVERISVPDLPADEPPAAVNAGSPGTAPAGDAGLRLAQEKFIREMVDEKERLEQQAEKGAKSARGRAKTSAPSPPAEPQSFDLVSDIDRIFQGKLAASPLAGTDAEILAGPDGGVWIRVADARYSTPGEVPDDVLRDLIRAAIEEW